MIKLDDLVSLAKAGWTPKQVKEVYELISTAPEAPKEAAPEELKAAAEIKAVEELPKEAPSADDPMEAIRKLIQED